VLIAAATNSSSTRLHSDQATFHSNHYGMQTWLHSCLTKLESAAQQPLDGRVETLHMLKQAPRILDGCHGNNVDLMTGSHSNHPRMYRTDANQNKQKETSVQMGLVDCLSVQT